VLCAPLFLWAYWLAHTDRPGWLAVAVLLMLATQENAALIVAMLGVVLLLEGLRRTGLLLLLVGLIWFAACLFVLLPALNPTGSNAFKRYRHFGGSWAEVAHHLVTHPTVLFAWIAGDGARAYLGRILLPFGYLSVLAPEVLVGATSEVAL